MKVTKYLLSTILILIVIFVSCNFTSSDSSIKSNEFQVLFYNVENLFDTENDSLTQDDEFTPDGKKEWNSSKLNHKISQLAKVITATDIDAPEFMGFSEVENEDVVKQLINHQLLYKHNYQVINIPSPDVRGIDVAFCYKKSSFNLTSFYAIPVKLFPRPTRDLLFVEGYHPVLKDSIRFVVVHWPSRYGGAKKSEPKRIKASQTLSNAIDSVKKIRPNYTTIVMGDFNDTPNNESIQQLTKHQLQYQNPKINKGIKTIKYKGTWYLYDGFIIDEKTIKKYPTQISTSIISFPWLLEEDKMNSLKPNRSFKGNFYNGGFSDHLPVMLNWKL